MATISAEANDIVPPFVIKELTGPRRELRLTGRALPYRPLQFSGTQRVEVSYYAGNPVATSTVTGSEEGDTTIQGKWKDKYIRSAATVTTPTTTRGGPATVSGTRVDTVAALVNLVDDMRMAGQLLEVSWGHITRRGHITSFSHTWDNLNDCEWSLAFKWTSQGQRVTPPVVANGPTPVGSLQAMRSSLADLEDTINDAPDTNSISGMLNEINRALSRARSAMDEYTSTAVSFADNVLSPVETARNALGLLNGVINGCTEIIDTYSQFAAPEDVFINPFVEDGEAYIKYFENLAYITEVLVTAKDLRSEAALEKQLQLRVLEAEVQAVHFARAGETLRDVSRQFYNTPDQWRVLMVYNGFREPELAVGDLVLVPVLTSGVVG